MNFKKNTGLKAFKGISLMYKSFIKRAAIWVLASFTLLACSNSAFAAATYDPLLESEYSYYTQSEQLFGNKDYLFAQPQYVVANVDIPTMAAFHSRLKSYNVSLLPKPKLVPIGVDSISIFIPIYQIDKQIGDAYVQQLSIRAQLKRLIGTYLLEQDERAQIDALYQKAYNYALLTNTVFGQPLDATKVTDNLIWPEYRTINGERVLVPVVYLTSSTISNYKIDDATTRFGGDITQFGGITIGAGTILDVRSKFLAVTNDLINNQGTLNLSDKTTQVVVGGTLQNLSGLIQSEADLNIIANRVQNKTVVYEFKDQYGSQTRLGKVASINGKDIVLRALDNIEFTGATVTAGGSLTLKADGDISILSQQYGSVYQGRYTSTSNIDYLASKLTAKENINLLAGGEITIDAANIESETGFVNIMAQFGIYLDTDTSERNYRYEKGTTLEESFKSQAIRAVIKAGKGVSLHTEHGDINIKAADITSTTGTEITALDGGVNLLISKELDHWLDQHVNKSLLTIKSTSQGHDRETAVYPSIVGGVQVEATHGVHVEYGTTKQQKDQQINLAQLIRVGAHQDTINTLKRGIANEQINAVAQMPGLEFLGRIKNEGVPVKWDEVILANDSWHKVDKTLSPAAMAIISIAVAVAVGPAGGNLLTQFLPSVASNATFGAAATAAASAGFTTLTTQAAIGFASGKSPSQILKEMNSSNSMKQLAISMVTAGAMSGIDSKYFKVAEGQKLELLDQAYQAVIHSTVSAGVSVTINGGNREDYRKAFNQSLATNAINTIGQNIANKISTAQSFDIATKYIAHAAMGCLSASLTAKVEDSDRDAACASAAAGAVISEAMRSKAENLEKEIIKWAEDSKNNPDAINFENYKPRYEYLRTLGADIPKLVAALTAFALGGDVNAAANSAATVAQSNMQKVVNLSNIYLDIYGNKNCGENTMAQCLGVKLRDMTIVSLTQQGIIGTEQEKYLKIMDDRGLFNTAGKIQAAFYGNGKVIDNTYHETFGTLTEVNGIKQLIVPGFDTFSTDISIFAAEFDKARLSLTPTEQKVLGTAVGVVVAGPMATIISSVQNYATEHILPEDIAAKIGDTSDKVTTAIGTGIQTYLDITLYENDNLVDVFVKGYNQTEEYRVKYEEYQHSIDGFGWLATNITGLGNKKGSNTSPTARYMHDGQVDKSKLPKQLTLGDHFDNGHLTTKLERNGQGKPKTVNNGLSGMHNAAEFERQLENPREVNITSEKIKNDAKAVVLSRDAVTVNGVKVGESIRYRMPATKADGTIDYNPDGSVKYIGDLSEAPTKTVYFPDKISDADYTAAAKRAAEKAWSEKLDNFILNPSNNREVLVIDGQTGMKFKVYFGGSPNGTPTITNAHLIP